VGQSGHFESAPATSALIFTLPGFDSFMSCRPIVSGRRVIFIKGQGADHWTIDIATTLATGCLSVSGIRTMLEFIDFFNSPIGPFDRDGPTLTIANYCKENRLRGRHVIESLDRGYCPEPP
jgi:hypothetical protein